MPTSPTLPGFTPADWTQAYGGRPVVPSPGATAGQAIGANLGNLGQLYGLAGNLNQFQASQAAGQYAANLPGYSGMLAQSSRNIGSLLRGEVPGDVISQIMQGAAERGIATGQAAPSPNTNAAMLRALGLTSLGLQSQGETELTGAIGRTPVAPIFQPSSMFITPEQQQQAQAAANLYAAAPRPADAARAAEDALRRGMATGGGAVGGAPISQGYRFPQVGAYGGMGDLTPVVAPSTGADVTYAGGLAPGAQDRWNQWYSSLNRGGWTSPETEQDVWASLGISDPRTESEAWGDLGVDLYGPSGTTESDVWGDLGVDIGG